MSFYNFSDIHDHSKHLLEDGSYSSINTLLATATPPGFVTIHPHSPFQGQFEVQAPTSGDYC